MQDHKLRFWMSSDDPVTRIEQLGDAGKVAAIEGPVGMMAEFLIAFVEAVRGREERNRIRNVNGDRYPELPAGLPHGIESWIVDPDQVAGVDVLAEVKSQGLQNLQPPCTLPMCPLNRIGLQLWVVGLLQPFITGFGEGIKASGMGPVVLLNHIPQSVVIAARQVDHGTDVFAIIHGA